MRTITETLRAFAMEPLCANVAMGQQLSADRERGNEEDRFTVAVDARLRLTMTGSEVRSTEGWSREREGSEQRGRSMEAWRCGAQRLEGRSRERRLRNLGGCRELGGVSEGLEIRQWRCSGQHLHCPISASAVCALPLIAYVHVRESVITALRNPNDPL